MSKREFQVKCIPETDCTSLCCFVGDFTAFNNGNPYYIPSVKTTGKHMFIDPTVHTPIPRAQRACYRDRDGNEVVPSHVVVVNGEWYTTAGLIALAEKTFGDYRKQFKVNRARMPYNDSLLTNRNNCHDQNQNRRTDCKFGARH